MSLADRPPPSPETPLRVRVLYSEGCPGGVVTGNILREVLSDRGVGAELTVEVFGHREFRALGTSGSPAILLNGHDLFPPVASPFGAFPTDSCCRLYATPEGFESHPTPEMVREALDTALEQAEV
ncbi:MAG: thioredoxin family protein [Rubrobacter sp.]|nr:thioredoxin family protein [Rubrobacter sp.]